MTAITTGGSAQALGVNGSGVVVGMLDIGLASERSFQFNGSLLSELAIPGATTHRAVDVNTAGQIIGWANTSAGERFGYRYVAGAVTRLPHVSGSTSTELTAQNSSVQRDGSIHAAGNRRGGLHSNNAGNLECDIAWCAAPGADVCS